MGKNIFYNHEYLTDAVPVWKADLYISVCVDLVSKVLFLWVNIPVYHGLFFMPMENHDKCQKKVGRSATVRLQIKKYNTLWTFFFVFCGVLCLL